MCAALFGLIAVCSTMALPASRAGAADAGDEAVEEKLRPLEEEVQVAVGRGRDLPDAFERAEGGGDLLRDGARRLAQPARELERDGRAEVAEIAVRRILEHERRPRRGLERIEGGDHQVKCARRRSWTGRIDSVSLTG